MHPNARTPKNIAMNVPNEPSGEYTKLKYKPSGIMKAIHVTINPIVPEEDFISFSMVVISLLTDIP